MARNSSSKPTEQKTFTVAAGRELRHDGDVYAEGDSVNLSDEQAVPLLLIGTLVAPAPQKTEAPSA